MKIFLTLILSSLCFGFSLTPLSQSIVVGKNNDTVIYQVQNNNKEPIALEVSLKERLMKIDGKEDQPDVDEDLFLIYPTQIVLKPGQKRGVKVKWLGSKKLKEEKSYRLVVEQLPVDFKKKSKTGVKLLLKYLGALYITSDKFRPEVKLGKVQLEKDKLFFPLENRGNKHKVLKNLIVVYEQKGKKPIEVTGKELDGFIGENILANSRRDFKIPVPTVFKGKDFSQGKFKLRYE